MSQSASWPEFFWVKLPVTFGIFIKKSGIFRGNFTYLLIFYKVSHCFFGPSESGPQNLSKKSWPFSTSLCSTKLCVLLFEYLIYVLFLLLTQRGHFLCFIVFSQQILISLGKLFKIIHCWVNWYPFKPLKMIKKKSSNEILLKNTQAKCFLASGHSNLSCRAGASWRKLAISKLEQGNEKHQDFLTLIQNTSITRTLLQSLLEFQYP